MSLPHQLVKSLVLDYLKGHPGGQVGELKADIKENPSAAPIFRAFLALQQRLEFMANQKKLPGDLAESIHGDLRGTFDWSAELVMKLGILPSRSPSMRTQYS